MARVLREDGRTRGNEPEKGPINEEIRARAKARGINDPERSGGQSTIEALAEFHRMVHVRWNALCPGGS